MKQRSNFIIHILTSKHKFQLVCTVLVNFFLALFPFNDLLFQKINFVTEDSESSGDEKKHEITSNFKEESNIVRNLLQKGQKPSRNEIPFKR